MSQPDSAAQAASIKWLGAKPKFQNEAKLTPLGGAGGLYPER